METRVSRQFANKHTAALLNVEVIGSGPTAAHAYENACKKLDEIELRFEAKLLYNTNLGLVARHEGGELLSETELEKARKQIAEFEAAEIVFNESAITAPLEFETASAGGVLIDLSQIIEAATEFFNKNTSKSNAKKSATKSGPAKKTAAKKTARKK